MVVKMMSGIEHISNLLISILTTTNYFVTNMSITDDQSLQDNIRNESNRLKQDLDSVYSSFLELFNIIQTILDHPQLPSKFRCAVVSLQEKWALIQEVLLVSVVHRCMALY